MSDLRPILTVGYDKNGELDWRIVVAELEELNVVQMRELRSHLMLAYGQLDQHWRQFGPPSRDYAVFASPQQPGQGK